jgi:hypothetical protein
MFERCEQFMSFVVRAIMVELRDVPFSILGLLLLFSAEVDILLAWRSYLHGTYNYCLHAVYE